MIKIKTGDELTRPEIQAIDNVAAMLEDLQQLRASEREATEKLRALGRYVKAIEAIKPSLDDQATRMIEKVASILNGPAS